VLYRQQSRLVVGPTTRLLIKDKARTFWPCQLVAASSGRKMTSRDRRRSRRRQRTATALLRLTSKTLLKERQLPCILDEQTVTCSPQSPQATLRQADYVSGRTS